MKHEGNQQASCLKIKSCVMQKLIYRTSVQIKSIYIYNVTGLNI